MSPKKRALTVTAASLFVAGFSVGPAFADTAEETASTTSPEVELQTVAPPRRPSSTLPPRATAAPPW
ncbi:hypothetical protein BJF83_09855 [Nocardiopsis sp. CNR-923]|uniref:hypothetical protein n=1 Tax=Nocardiopsis sp. CNR-923 TaxID=1904965 RepID=UPI00095AD0AD|nr:hypothetical protein [Nocardiopsis sp. CNR-923]OLT29974.1 hypothetical protein BJF83_09855 [Nocardiopsis sp. CNR-923]